MSSSIAHDIPPQNLEAESAVLGSILTDRAMLDEVAGLVRPEDFYSPQNARIYAAMLDLARTEQPIDAVTLAEQASSLSAVARAEEFTYYALLQRTVPSAGSARFYAQVVQEKASLRALIHAAGEIKKSAYRGEGDIERAFSEADAAWRRANERKSASVGPMDLHGAIRHRYDEFAAMVGGEDVKKGQETPWERVNESLGGFVPGNLITWAGAAKAGKSGAVLTLADHVAERYGPVMYVSLEVPLKQMVMRYLALHSGVSVMQQFRGGRTREEGLNFLDRIADAQAEIATRPIYFYGRNEAGSVAHIRRELRSLSQREKVVTIFVDGLNFLRECEGDNERSTLNDRLNSVYIDFLRLAAEYEVVLHVVTHVNRKGQDRIRPTARDIRDGGNPEGHSDAVIIPWRENPLSDDAGERAIGEFIIAAARCGIEGSPPMHFDGASGRWTER